MGVAFGILLGLGGSLFINTGNNLQSLGMHEAQGAQVDGGGDELEQPNLCKNKTWVIGTVIFVSGALLNFASYGFAPQSTLASLESIQFVSNLFFGWWLLEKEISQRMMFGTALTVGGTVLAVVFSSKDAAEIEDVDDLVQLWNNYLWITYVILLGAFAVVLQLGYKQLEKKGKLKDSEKGSSKEFENIMAVIYAVLSALFGTLSVVFAKLLAKLFELQGAGENIFEHWYTYTTILAWLVLMGFWLYRLNDALSLYNPLFIIPLLQANFIFFAILSGGIYFQEFNYMIKLNWIGFVFGIILMFVGIALLTPPKSNEPIPNEDSGLDIERQPTTTSLKEDLKGGCCRGGLVKLLMTGPARMYEEDYYQKKRREYTNIARETQNNKAITVDGKILVQKVYENITIADKMELQQTQLEDMNLGHEIDEAKTKKVQEKMKQWKNSKKKLEINDTEIKKIRRKMTKDKQNESSTSKGG